MAQREKPSMTPGQLAYIAGKDATEGIKCSGGQFESFKEGWAKAIMNNSERAHYFVRDDFEGALSLCGVSSPVRWIYGPGNYTRCAHCVQRLKFRKKYG